jgi:hypothetical protein
MSFYDLKAKFRPIDRWPGEPTRHREDSRFKAAWSDTMVLLGKELEQLGGKNIICQVAIGERYIRQDGYPYANAVASHPGIILAFDSKYGPLKYSCDRFFDWQDNVRAIALALEALRKVDRYGITKRGEQYTGWKALPASSAHPAMTVEMAASFMSEHSAGAFGTGVLVGNRTAFDAAYRAVAKRLHPDVQGGDTSKFQLLQEAKRVLGVHHGVTANGSGK